MGNLLITTNNELTILKDELTTTNNELTTTNNEINRIKAELTILKDELTKINNKLITTNNEQTIQEQTEFTVRLDKIGNNKVNVIKEIRAITDLQLRDAIDLAEQCPISVKEFISKAYAKKIKKILEDAGAKVSII